MIAVPIRRCVAPSRIASAKSPDIPAEIDSAAAQAKAEADLLAHATKTAEGIAKAVDSVTGLVTKIGALPFL